MINICIGIFILVLMIEILAFFGLRALNSINTFTILSAEFAVFALISFSCLGLISASLNLTLASKTYESKLDGVVSLSSLDKGFLELNDASQSKPLLVDFRGYISDFYNEDGTIKSEHLYDYVSYNMSISEDFSEVVRSIFRLDSLDKLIKVDSVKLKPNTVMVDMPSSKDGSTVSVPFPESKSE